MELSLINRLTAKAGKRSEVVKILLESARPFQDHPSCLLYLVYEDKEDENIIWVVDLWTSEADHAAELAKPELQEYVKKAIPMLEGMPEQIAVDLVGGKGPGHSLG